MPPQDAARCSRPIIGREMSLGALIQRCNVTKVVETAAAAAVPNMKPGSTIDMMQTNHGVSSPRSSRPFSAARIGRRERLI